MFYETQHSSDTSYFRISRGTDFSFPPHLHEAFEWICITEGETRITVGEQHYDLHAGEAVLVFPDQVHSYETCGHSAHFFLIFSPTLVKAFSSARKGFIPQDARHTPTAELLALLSSLTEQDTPLRIKGALYLLAAEFDRGRAYTARGATENALLSRIFDYIKTHYSTTCTLASLADELCYSYVYLSRYFRERTGLRFLEYVSQYRIREACYRLENEATPIVTIALECGFDTVRSFHRNFRKQTGLTPVDYRKEAQKQKN